MDFNKLWQNFVDTIQNHYMDFEGRVGVPQFWYFILVSVGVLVIAGILGAFVLGLLAPLVGLALLLPTGALAARRLQDSGQNGSLVWVWIAVSAINRIMALLIVLAGPLGALGFFLFFFSIGWLLNIVELVAVVALIYFCVQPGTPGPNPYGPVPPVFKPN